LKLEFPGGVRDVPTQIPEYHGEYPEGTLFGNLPAYAFYLRHVDGATFRDCNFSVDHPDARPWLVTEDVANLVQANVIVGGPQKNWAVQQSTPAPSH